jgi:hypothetical protein
MIQKSNHIVSNNNIKMFKQTKQPSTKKRLLLEWGDNLRTALPAVAHKFFSNPKWLAQDINVPLPSKYEPEMIDAFINKMSEPDVMDSIIDEFKDEAIENIYPSAQSVFISLMDITIAEHGKTFKRLKDLNRKSGHRRFLIQVVYPLNEIYWSYVN